MDVMGALQLLDAAVDVPAANPDLDQHDTSLLAAAASLLELGCHKLVKCSEAEAQAVGTSVSTLTRATHALAEACLQRQTVVAEDCLRYACHTLGMRPLCYIHRLSYDATPMLLRVHTSQSSPLRQPDAETAKVYVIEAEWSALLQKPLQEGERDHSDNYLLLRGAVSPAVRCCNRSTTTALLQVLATTFAPPRMCRRQFPLYLRVVESDGDSSNSKAELCLHAAANSEGNEQLADLGLLHLMCSAHRLHTAAQRCWAHEQSIVTGITRSCLVLAAGGAMQKLSQSIDALVAEQLVVVRNLPLSAEAVSYRESLLTLLHIPTTTPRRKAELQVITTRILNGDWRRRRLVEHRCHIGCCEGEAQSRHKVATALKRAFSLLRPSIFAKNDWKSWADSWRFITFGCSVHMVLPDLFRRTFTEEADPDVEEHVPLAAEPPRQAQPEMRAEGVAAAGQQELQRLLQTLGNAEVADIHATRTLTRAQRAANLRCALAFLHDTPQWWPRYLVLRVSLEPEILLMSRLLESTSSSAMHSTMQQGHRGERWNFFGLELQSGSFTQPASRKFQEQLFSTTLWPSLCLNETEFFRTHVLQMLSRLQSCIWEKVAFTANKFPLRLLSLLQANTDEVAGQILHTPPCVRGDLANQLIGRYSTIERLRSPEFQQILWQLGSLVQATTFSTERLHSRNLRRSRMRVCVTRADIKMIALNHVGFAGPSWLRHLRIREAATVQCKPGRPLRSRTGLRVRVGAKRTADGSFKLRGGGGAWRAFLRERMSAGPSGFTSAAMQEWRQEYWSLSDDDWQRYASLGRQGLPFSVQGSKLLLLA